MALAVGDRVPRVVLPDTSGAPLALDGSDGPLLVVFVPYAFSPVCSGEVADLTAMTEEILAGGLRLVVVSCDPLPALRAWLVDAPFDGASDFWPHGAAADAFGVLDAGRGVAGRGTFLVEDGLVRWSLVSAAGAARPVDAYREMLAERTGSDPS